MWVNYFGKYYSFRKLESVFSVLNARVQSVSLKEVENINKLYFYSECLIGSATQNNTNISHDAITRLHCCSDVVFLEKISYIIST